VPKPARCALLFVTAAALAFPFRWNRVTTSSTRRFAAGLPRFRCQPPAAFCRTVRGCIEDLGTPGCEGNPAPSPHGALKDVVHLIVPRVVLSFNMQVQHRVRQHDADSSQIFRIRLQRIAPVSSEHRHVTINAAEAESARSSSIAKVVVREVGLFGPRLRRGLPRLSSASAARCCENALPIPRAAARPPLAQIAADA